MEDIVKKWNDFLDRYPPMIGIFSASDLKNCNNFEPDEALTNFFEALYAGGECQEEYEAWCRHRSEAVIPEEWVRFFDGLTVDFLRICYTFDFIRGGAEHQEGYFDFLREAEAKKRKCTFVYTKGGQSVPRGYFCPLPDVREDVGKKCSWLQVLKKDFDYKFWFDGGDLIRIENSDELESKSAPFDSDEFILRLSSKRTAGFRYETTNGKICWYGMTLCEYQDERLVRYISFLLPNEKPSCGYCMQYREYGYADGGIREYSVDGVSASSSESTYYMRLNEILE